MTIPSYRLTERVDGFDEGRVFDLTAQYGDWHVRDVKLEPQPAAVTGSVELTWDELRAVTEEPKEAVEA